jgi:hypothetical protein
MKCSITGILGGALQSHLGANKNEDPNLAFRNSGK